MRKLKRFLQIVGMILSKSGVERAEFWEMVKEIFFRRVYNPEGFEIGADDMVVDIGANVGVFTVFAANKTKNKVYAYEPFFKNFEALKLNTNTGEAFNYVDGHSYLDIIIVYGVNCDFT